MKSEDENVILNSISEGVFTVDSDWRITFFNRAAEDITGVSAETAVGMRCRDVLLADVCEDGCTLRETMRTGKPITNRAVRIVDANGERKTIKISTALLKDADGQIIGGVETFRDTTAIDNLRKELSKTYSYEDIISQNHKVLELFSILPNIAESNTTVYIEGESGTGKELFARAVHNLSFRKDKPFIVVNCGALPDNLLESELFGYKAGAFTDAKKDKPGRFALAEGGTIFLDEIGDISPAVQVKLLRVLQEKTYEPVGGIETVHADVRIITATNKQLDKLVKEGRFRDDLYYRINIMKLELPPLRERKEDIPLLVDHFIDKYNNLQNKDICCVTSEVSSILLGYDFPGNIRELENIIEHAFVLCTGDVIEARHLPMSLTKTSIDTNSFSTKATSLKQMEIAMIRQALAQCNGNKTAAAKQLGIDKSTLFRKIKTFNL